MEDVHGLESQLVSVILQTPIQGLLPQYLDQERVCLLENCSLGALVSGWIIARLLTLVLKIYDVG